MNLTEIAQLAFIPIVFIASYLYIRPFIPAWSVPTRGFQPFEKQWPKIFIGGAAVSILTTVLLLSFTPINSITAITLGTISGLLLIAGYTDSIVYKVPAELSELTIRASFILGIGTLIYNGFFYSDNPQRFYETIPLYLPGDWYYWVGGALIIGLLGFFIWIRMTGIIGLLGILISVSGLWLALYAGLKQLASFLATTPLTNHITPEGINNILVYGIPSALAVVFFAIAFQLGSDGKMGDADPAAMYAVGWSFGPVIGGITVGIGVIIACIVQLILHIFAKPLKISGRMKTVPYDPVVYNFVKLWWKIKGKTGEPEKTYRSLGLPFLPVLVVSAVVTMILGIATF